MIFNYFAKIVFIVFVICMFTVIMNRSAFTFIKNYKTAYNNIVPFDANFEGSKAFQSEPSLVEGMSSILDEPRGIDDLPIISGIEDTSTTPRCIKDKKYLGQALTAMDDGSLTGSLPPKGLMEYASDMVINDVRQAIFENTCVSDDVLYKTTTKDVICENDYTVSTKVLDKKCGYLKTDDCRDVPCCIMYNDGSPGAGYKCLSGSKLGPTNTQDVNSENSDEYHYYHENVCYGPGCKEL